MWTLRQDENTMSRETRTKTTSYWIPMSAMVRKQTIMNWRDVQTKNVGMSYLRAQWQTGLYKN